MSEPLRRSYVVPEGADPMIQRLAVLDQVFREMATQAERIAVARFIVELVSAQQERPHD